MNAPVASPSILVTGGSMGIGRACAERLAADGARIVIAARGSEAIEETVATLPGEGHEGLVLDVSDLASWEQAAPALAELGGLVHAAAVIGPIGPIERIDPAGFGEVLRVNVLGTFLALQACLPALRASSGRAVVFSGGGGTGPLPRFDAYAASKAAVVRLVENLSLEGIEINAVAPGFVATRMAAATVEAGPETVGEEYYESTRRGLKQGGTPPEKAAELVTFLLSEAAAGISGKLISAPWDPWREPEFQERLRSEQDFATIRRVDGQFFAAVPAN